MITKCKLFDIKKKIKNNKGIGKGSYNLLKL